MLFAFLFMETAANEIDYILHTTSSSYILKIDPSDLFSVIRKAKVGKLSISVNNRLVWIIGEYFVNLLGTLF